MPRDAWAKANARVVYGPVVPVEHYKSACGPESDMAQTVRQDRPSEAPATSPARSPQPFEPCLPGVNSFPVSPGNGQHRTRDLP
jgi:hypothetical protein